MQLKSRFFWVAPIFLFALGLIGYVRQVPQVPDYIIMIDAGSTGSRLFIYPVGSSRISAVNSLIGRDLNGVLKKKVEPGLLQYRDDPQRAAESLQPLIEFALKNIPARNHRSTPIYLRATGGLRSLPQSNVDAILTSIRKQFSKLPFKVEDSHISVITGSEEALYGWVSLNFLLEADEPFGALDMGGSSTQISLTLGQTVAPSLCKHSVNYLDKTHQVCAVSLQGFGLESAYQAYRQSLIEEADAKKNYVVKSPCLSKGHVEHVYITGSPSSPKIGKITVTVIGEGNFDSCLGKLLPVLSQQKKAADPAISLLPALANENDFVAFNGFVQTHRALGLQRRPSLREWQEASREFCSLDWKDVEARSQPANRCFKAAWLQLILHQVYGLSFEERRIDFVKEVTVSNSQWVEGSNIPETHNVEVSWTIGAVLLELASANMS